MRLIMSDYGSISKPGSVVQPKVLYTSYSTVTTGTVVTPVL